MKKICSLFAIVRDFQVSSEKTNANPDAHIIDQRRNGQKILLPRGQMQIFRNQVSKTKSSTSIITLLCTFWGRFLKTPIKLRPGLRQNSKAIFFISKAL